MIRDSSSLQRSPISSHTRPPGRMRVAQTPERTDVNLSHEGRVLSPFMVRQYFKFPGPHGGSL